MSKQEDRIAHKQISRLSDESASRQTKEAHLMSLEPFHQCADRESEDCNV